MSRRFSRIPPPVWILFGIAALAVLVFTTGCGTTPQGDPAFVQRVLDEALPPGFRGDAEIEHKNPWIDITITVRDVRKEGGRWVWASFKWKRNGRFSQGNVRLGLPPEF